MQHTSAGATAAGRLAVKSGEGQVCARVYLTCWIIPAANVNFTGDFEAQACTTTVHESVILVCLWPNNMQDHHA